MATTRQQALQALRRKLEEGPDDLRALAALEARILIEHVCGLSHEDLVMEGDRPIKSEEEAMLQALSDRRLAGEPIAYLIGEKEFYGLTFKVSPSVLIPRPDTEVLVDLGVAHLKKSQSKKRVLDLGTGSGALLLSILHQVPEATGLGIDTSPDALAIASANAEAFGLTKRADLRLGNWCEGVEGPFDLVVSNPPYIRSAELSALSRDVRDHEPHLALDGGADGLDPLRQLAADLPGIVASDALILVETGYDQTEQAALILRNAGLNPDKTVPDLNGLPRCVAARP